MRDLIQSTVDSVAKWGPWLCALLIAGSLGGLLRLWRNNRSLQARARTSLLFKSSWFSRLVVAGIGLWLLKVQLAPLTTSLTTLRSGRGEQIRAFSFRHVSNDQLQHISELKGKVVVLNLWATYCAPCVQELPTLNRLQFAYKERGLIVLALSDEPRERLQQFLTKHPVDVLVGYAALEWLKLENFRPMTLIIDRNGVLRKHFFGKTDFEGFEAQIRPYL